MARATKQKVVKSFWAYCVADGQAVLVRCEDRDHAEWQKDMMKWSKARTVGYTSRAVSEKEMRDRCQARGWTVTTVC